MQIHPLKIYLLKNRITLKDFAKRCNMPYQNLYRIMNYKLTDYPRKSTVEKLHQLTGIPKMEFLYPAEDEKIN